MRIFFGTFFKVLAIFLAISSFIFLLGLTMNFLNSETERKNFTFLEGNQDSNNTIALINLKGPIISDPINFYNFGGFANISAIYPSLIEEYLKELKRKNISGILVSIDSPGGSVSATHDLYNLFNDFNKEEQIPIYFHSKNLLASGAYWLALSGNKIFTNYGALIGSIGVKGPDWIYYNYPTSISSGILGYNIETKNGIEIFSNTAGKSKDLFNPFRPPTNEEIDHLQKMVNDIYNDFLTIVVSSRKIERDILKKKIGAKIYNSEKAYENNLIDGEKNINQIIAILSRDLGMKDIKVIHNGPTNQFSLNNFYIFLKSFNQNNFEKNNYIINKEFCNNLKNQFSVVSISHYQDAC